MAGLARKRLVHGAVGILRRLWLGGASAAKGLHAETRAPLEKLARRMLGQCMQEDIDMVMRGTPHAGGHTN